MLRALLLFVDTIMGIEQSLSESARKANTEDINTARKNEIEIIANGFAMSVEDLNSLAVEKKGETETLRGTVNGVKVEITKSEKPEVTLNGKTLHSAYDSEEMASLLFSAVEKRDHKNAEASNDTQEKIYETHDSETGVNVLRDKVFNGNRQR